MALINSRTTQDNLIIIPTRLNHHQLDSKPSDEQKVPVVYYLSRNGQLDHPHFIEVPLSSHNGLYLKGSKNLIFLLCFALFFQILDLENNSGKESNFSAVTHRRNQSLSSIDHYKASTESARKLATDASTQTDDRRLRKSPEKEVDEVNEITELSREEITSPPQSDSSPETLESLMKADGRLILLPEDQELNRTVDKMRPSAVLMQLISCGAMSFKKCSPMLMNGNTRSTVVRGTGNYRLERAEKGIKEFW